jgi:hypothetical protein
MARSARAPRHVRASRPLGTTLDLAFGRPNGTVTSNLQVVGAGEKTAKVTFIQVRLQKGNR